MAIDLGLPVIQSRTCGSCTKCCEGYLQANVDGVEIRGTGCALLQIGKGCSIYEKRPYDPCQTFKCLWQVSEEVPEEFKPSESNVIMMVDELYGERYILAKEAGAKMPAEVVTWLFGQALNSNNNICYEINGRFYYYGSKRFIEIMQKDSGTTFTV